MIMKIVFFCAAGYSFFIGAGLLIAAFILPELHIKIVSRIIRYFTGITGVFLIFLSATPLPLWFYIVWIIMLLSCILGSHFSKTRRINTVLKLSVILLCITAIIMEVPFLKRPLLPGKHFEILYVIGDSVSAGIAGKDEQTWPKIIRKKYGINLIDLSAAGATAGTAISQAMKVDKNNALIFIEIGGNDLFEPTPSCQFEHNLRLILEKISNQQNTIIMMELPLFPWDIEYGRIQRRLAKQFNVTLIPKRFFVNVLSTDGATADLAHLTEKGHKLMAEMVWSFLGNAMIPHIKSE